VKENDLNGSVRVIILTISRCCCCFIENVLFREMEENTFIASDFVSVIVTEFRSNVP
jgi:hypothetical protein